MNWHEVEEHWSEVKGYLRVKYMKLTEDDARAIAGQKDALIAKLQECYGMTYTEAQNDAEAFLESSPIGVRKQNISGGASM